MRRLAAVLVVCLAPSLAWAQPSDRAVDDGGGWAEVFDPERRMGRHYRRLGLARLVQAMISDRAELGDAPEWLVLEQALVRFERARRLIPDDPELAYYTAWALSLWERPASDGGTERRVGEAIDAWHRVRELDPDFMPAHVAYQLAMLHMRRHEFGRARAEYDVTLRHAVPPTLRLRDRFYMAVNAERALATFYAPHDPANVRANLAEVTMLTGDVRAAARHYATARELADDPLTRSLAQWGLAVATSRDDDHAGALEVAHRAIREDPIPPDDPRFSALHRRHGAFSVLHLDTVFFEPSYEIHAYEAIGHEAHARDPDADRASHLRQALRSWRLFLAEGGTTSRYATHAREHAERLEAVVDELGDEGVAVEDEPPDRRRRIRSLRHWPGPMPATPAPTGP